MTTELTIVESEAPGCRHLRLMHLLGGRLLEVVALGSVAALALLLSADATLRYVFKAPIQGLDEIASEYLMIFAIFLGLAWGYASGGLIRVDVVVRRLRGRVADVVNYTAHSIGIATAVVFCVAAVRQAQLVLESGTTFRNTQGILGAFPLWPAYAVTAIGLIVLVGSMIADLQVTRLRRRFAVSSAEDWSTAVEAERGPERGRFEP